MLAGGSQSHCQSDCQTSWFKDMSSVLIILCFSSTWQLSGKVKWKFISLFLNLRLEILLPIPSPDQSWHCIPLNYSGVDDADTIRERDSSLICTYFKSSRPGRRVWRNFQWIICHPNESILINCKEISVLLKNTITNHQFRLTFIDKVLSDFEGRVTFALILRFQ